jgi:transposase
MRQELLGDTYIQADETPVEVQIEESCGKNHQAYLWQYGRPGGGAVFDFQASRGRDGPKQFLGQFAGRLQTDGYATYDQIGGPGMVHAGCWSHAERYFSEVLELNPKDPLATPIVERIDELFAIDAEAGQQGLSLEARDALPQEKARPLLEVIRQQIEVAYRQVLPSSRLAKPCQYTLSLWDKLTLSNNLADNTMRPITVGRRNWIHIGSPASRAKDRGDFLRGGKLPVVEDPSAGLLGCNPSRNG